MMRGLAPGYSVETDRMDKGQWGEVLERFEDASIYQTWAYGSVIGGIRNHSHLVLKKNGKIAAAAQVRIARVPLLNLGAAYVRWGPVWKLHGGAPDPGVFQQMVRALRNEYACRRGLVTRILPLIFDDSHDTFATVLEEEGFGQLSIQGAQRTLLVDLSGSLAELRKGLDQKWRNRLNKAEKNSIRVMEGCEDGLFERFIGIYKEMHGRKRFLETSDVHQYRLIQRDLADPLRMRVFLAYFNGEPAAGVICSQMGDMAVYLFAGTSNAGLNSQGSYLLQWKVICWLKETGVRWYNLHGINPDANPGTFRFKTGLCGKNGRDVHYLGTYETHENPMASRIVWMANFSRNQVRRAKIGVGRLMA